MVFPVGNHKDGIRELLKEMNSSDTAAIYVKKIDCLGMQIILEKRLTKLESLQFINMIGVISVLLVVILNILKAFGG